MSPPATCSTILLLTVAVVCNAGLLKRRGNKDEGVETLLAVGLLAKALADDSPSSANTCPPPVHITKIIPIHVPVHKERIIYLPDKSCGEAKYHESKQTWDEALAQNPDNMENHNWK